MNFFENVTKPKIPGRPFINMVYKNTEKTQWRMGKGPLHHTVCTVYHGGGVSSLKSIKAHPTLKIKDVSDAGKPYS